MKKLVSILTPTFNEEENIENMVNTIKEIFSKLPNYSYEHLVIDNNSSDKTQNVLRRITSIDKNVKVIFNSRNFGWIRSPFHGMLQCKGDAVVQLCSDFQEPPELIIEFLKKWEEGFKIVIGDKSSSKENWFMFKLRRSFYKIMTIISDENPPVENFTGFGLYDKEVIKEFKGIQDQYPYLRGLVTELGYDIAKIPFTQLERKAGKSKSNFIRLYDMAMLGFTNHSKFPLRLSAFLGFTCSILSLIVALIYIILKLMYWDDYQMGFATLTIGIFFFSSVQLFFIGMLGEYIGAINSQIRKRPLVVEKERINF